MARLWLLHQIVFDPTPRARLRFAAVTRTRRPAGARLRRGAGILCGRPGLRAGGRHVHAAAEQALGRHRAACFKRYPHTPRARVHARYRTKGVEFVRPLTEEPWGQVAVFRDLYGNLWDLIQPGPSA